MVNDVIGLSLIKIGINKLVRTLSYVAKTKNMKRLLLFSLTILLSAGSFATELNYNWKAGTGYHFTAIVNDDIATSMMGMQVNEEFTTTTDFVLYIQNVAVDGTASGILYLVNFKISDSQGNIYASLNDLPKEMLKSDIQVDRKGNFTFPHKIYLITTAQGNVLAYGSGDENSVQVGGQVGNISVDAYAEFDPKTGKLKAGYTTSQLKTTRKINVKVDEESNTIDAIPYSFLELLALPEGDILLNDEFSVTAGMYQMIVKVNSMDNGMATLHHTMNTDKKRDMFDASASGQRGNGIPMFDMNMDTNLEDNDTGNDGDVDLNFYGMDMDMMNDMDDMDMGDMGMTQEDQMALATSKSMSPDMNGDITSSFDYGNGMFENVKGTITTEMNAMGMKMKVISNLEMVLNH